MKNVRDEIEKKILDTFSSVASTVGYSPIHGKIIGVLLMKGKILSLQDIAKATGYSPSMVSISIDFLELTGIVKRVRKTGDRKLYIELDGDLLEALKLLVLSKVEKGIENSLEKFEREKKNIEGIKDEKEREEIKLMIETLEKEIYRMQRYVKLLAGIRP